MYPLVLLFTFFLIKETHTLPEESQNITTIFLTILS